MDLLTKGVNPRDILPAHRERGPKRYGFTKADIMAAAGATSSVLQYAFGKGRPFELSRIAAFVSSRLARRAKLIDGVAEFGAKWDARWPRFEVFRCGGFNCTQLVLGTEQLCYRHGGPMCPQVKFSPTWYFVLRIGRVYVPYHRLATCAPAGMDVHHRDFNKWNNRVDNLAVVTHEEHMVLHRKVSADGSAPTLAKMAG